MAMAVALKGWFIFLHLGDKPERFIHINRKPIHQMCHTVLTQWVVINHK